MSSATVVLPALGAGSTSARFAFPISSYNVTYEGSGSYAVDSADTGGGYGKQRATFHWKVTYPLTFIRLAGHGSPASSMPDTRVAAVTGRSPRTTAAARCARSRAA